jgi:hypothetical protein
MSASARAPAARSAPARGPAVPPARKPRAKAAAGSPRFGRLGKWGWAALLGVGTVTLSPVVHAFWGDFGVIALGIFGLGFLLGRWTAQ